MTYPELIQELLNSNDERIGIYDVNKNIVEVSAKSKKRPAFAKIAINEDDAQKLLAGSFGIHAKSARAFLIIVDQSLVSEIFDRKEKGANGVSGHQEETAGA
jgi:hypothetical protein